MIDPRLVLASALLSCGLLAGCKGDDPESSPAPPAGEPSTPESAGAEPATPEPGAPSAPPTNPLAGTPPATPAPLPPAPAFEGQFTGDGLTLDLVGVGDRLQGTMAFRGDVYPVRARIEADGALVGAFETKGRSYGLRAVFQGERVELTSSNKTYLLERQPREDLLAGWVEKGRPAPTFAGRFLGSLEGRPLSLQLEEASGQLQGTLACGGRRFVVHAQRASTLATGEALEPVTGARYALALAPAADRGVRLWISVGEPPRQLSVDLARADD